MEVIEHFKVTLDYEVTVDPDTGNVETRLVNKSIDKAGFKSVEVKEPKKKKVSKNESSTPTLTLEDNKYCLNSAAVELMGVKPDDKLDIKYEKSGKDFIPVIGDDTVFKTKSGNRVTKTFTVSFRGNKNAELRNYGEVFTIIPHTEKEGLFILQNPNKAEEPEREELISEEDFQLPLDEDLENLTDEDVVEIDENFFQL
jgi:hypothetical protein